MPEQVKRPNPWRKIIIIIIIITGIFYLLNINFIRRQYQNPQVKVYPVNISCRHRWMSSGITVSTLDFGERWGEWSTPSSDALPPGKESRYPLWLGGLGAGWTCAENLAPKPSRITDYAIPAAIRVCTNLQSAPAFTYSWCAADCRKLKIDNTKIIHIYTTCFSVTHISGYKGTTLSIKYPYNG